MMKQRKEKSREFILPPLLRSLAVVGTAILVTLITVLIFTNAEWLKAFFLPVLFGYLVVMVLILGILLHKKYRRETKARYGLSEEELKELEETYKQKKRRQRDG